MAVPYTFATATGSIPLSQLDTNFATGIIIGNTTVTLGDTITTINNLTLANVTVTSASFSNVTLTGNTTFSGAAVRVLGDFSNATIANRTSFQASTTNDFTTVQALPNGTSAVSSWVAFASSDPTNAAYISIQTGASENRLVSTRTGSGTALPLTFNVGNGAAEAARFDTSGRFLLGTVVSVFAGSSANAKLIPTSTATGGIATGSYNNVGPAIDFYANIGTSAVYSGSISLSGATTTYGSASDYRLKSNPQTLTGSGAFIDALQPRTWTWASDGKRGVGFIAHEVAVVSPSSVVGEKDAVDANGNPKYQSMEYGSAEFIANIVAELQSLRARVAALESA